MIIVLAFFCLWNMIALCIVTSRVHKLNKHHHGGFTQGSRVYLEKE